MKKISACLIALLLSFTGATSVNASGDEVLYIESDFTSESTSSIEVLPMLRGTYLMSGTATITSQGIGYVGATTCTYATSTVAYVGVKGSLQRYSNGSWSTVATWSASANNSKSVGVTKLYSVSRGYYYRVYSVHTANSETNFGATSGIYIS